MNKRIKTRLLITVGITVLSVVLFAGFPPSLAKMKQKIRLGLDLQGGIRMVMLVVTDDAIRAETDQAIQSLRAQLQQENIAVRQMTRTQVNQFTAVVDPAKDADFQRIVSEFHPEWDIISTT